MQDASEKGRHKAGTILAQLSDQNYRTLIELCPDALIVHDGETIILANHAMADLVGLPSIDEIIGCPVLDFVASSSRALARERIRRMHQTSSAPLVDEVWKRVDGSEVKVEVAARHVPWVAPKAAMVIVRDVTERRRLEEEREGLLSEKELLMREVHHRVANSLQLVRSLLSLQARGSNNEEVKIHLSEASARIGTISILHSRLQNDSSVVEGEVQSYIEGVMTDLRTSLGETYKRPIILDPGEMPPLTLKADLLVALGLITTEAVTNSIKYGSGHIRVRLAKGDAHLEISIEDEGTGFPQEFDATKRGQGLGMRMIASLAQSRGGKVIVGGDEGAGARSRIAARIPL
jgi:PAS domain S-box-containing protein